MIRTRYHRSSVAAGALLAVALGEVLTTVVAGAASGLSWQGLVDLLAVSNAMIGLALAVAGWPIALHRPRNPIGWLLLAGGCCWAATAAGITVLACAADQGWTGPPWRILATLTNGGWPWALDLFMPLALLLFPDGRLPGPRWRWLLIPIAIGALLFTAPAVLHPWGLSSELGFQGYGTWASYPRFAWTVNIGAVAGLIGYGGALAGLVVRYRRGSEQIRRQLLWLLLALLVVLPIFVVDSVLHFETVFSILPIALVPLSITVALLRHQLLDIRLVVSRSVLYLLLTLGVIGAYLGFVAVLDVAFRRQIAPDSSLLATLAIAMAFNPVRVWLQGLLDRAFYGARRDPVRAMSEVGARLGDVGVTADPGLAGVLEALCKVMRFPSAIIVVDGTKIAAYGEQPPARHAIQLRHGDEPLGELIVGLRSGESRVDSADEKVIGLLAAPVAVAVHAGLLAVRAGALAEELRHSRERVISGREEERRRLRRDLHDGLGPVLTSVVLNADAAWHLIGTDPLRSAALLIQLRDQTVAAIDDIRRLVYDLRPPALDGMGLIGALREHVLVLSRRADGAPLTVTVDAPESMPGLPAATEVAAYRIVTEALTNVTRHSSAGTAVVTLATEQGLLHVRIHDDGVNVGSGWQPGVGLTSIRERAAELGGSCDIQHDRTGGRVNVSLPLATTRTPTADDSAAETGAPR